jgi:hypothetical protein
MKISNERKMGNAGKKTLDAFRGPAILVDASMGAARGLIRECMFDDVDVAAIPVAEKNSKAFLLVYLNRRGEKGPEGVR